MRHLRNEIIDLPDLLAASVSSPDAQIANHPDDHSLFDGFQVGVVQHLKNVRQLS